MCASLKPKAGERKEREEADLRWYKIKSNPPLPTVDTLV